jgi:hypothetical protein
MPFQTFYALFVLMFPAELLLGSNSSPIDEELSWYDLGQASSAEMMKTSSDLPMAFPKLPS